MSNTVHVRSRLGDYPVIVEVGLLGRLAELLVEHVGARRYAVISDDRVAALHGHPTMETMREAGLDASLFTFPAGEASKTRKSWSILTDELLESGFGRDSCVVAIGGGVTTDLAGFVAAAGLSVLRQAAGSDVRMLPWWSQYWFFVNTWTNRTPRSTSRRAIRQRVPYSCVSGSSIPYNLCVAAVSC